MCKCKGLRLFFFELSGIFFPVGNFGDRLRGRIMRPLFKSCGHTLKIKKGVYFLHPENIVLGDKVFISNYCTFGAGEFELEDEALIGPNVAFTATNHTVKDDSYRFGKPEGDKIVIGQGAWIGANACILSGVRIGRCALVAAGAVVNRSVEDFDIVGGVPAKVIRNIKQDNN